MTTQELDPALHEARIAADPATALQTLADLAYREPSLRPLVAANPSTYQDLLVWLADLRDPAVDSALRLRSIAADPASATPEPAVNSEASVGPNATAPTAHAPAVPVGAGPVDFARPGSVITRERAGAAVAIVSFVAGDLVGALTQSGLPGLLTQSILLAAALVILPNPKRRGLAFVLLAADLVITGASVATENTMIGSAQLGDLPVQIFNFFVLTVLTNCLGIATWFVARQRTSIVFVIFLPVAVGLSAIQNWVVDPAVYSAASARIIASGGSLVLTNLGLDLLSLLVWIGIVVAAGIVDAAIKRSRPAPLAAARMEEPVSPPIAGQIPAMQAPRTNVLAVLALIFGLLGSSVVAVVLGHIALSQIRRTNDPGRGLALAGLILGYVALAVVLGFLVFYIILFANISSNPYGG